MGEFASIDTVELAWNQLVPDEMAGYVDYLIGKAERLVRDRVPTLSARITAGKLTAATVGDIVVDMVLRVLRNPDGYRYEAAGDYSYQRDLSVAAGVMSVQPSELARLRGNPGQVSSVPVGDDALTDPLRRDWRDRSWDYQS